MSATLSAGIEAGPVERTRADVVVVFFFETDRPLLGAAGRADWRLCGQLSRLILAGKLSGAAGEAVLVPTAGGLAAPLLVGLGLGSRSVFDADACEGLGHDAVERALRLRAKTVALPLADPRAGDLDLQEHLEALVRGAVRALADASIDLRLRLVPAASEVARAQQALAGLARNRRPAAVALRLEGLPASAGARTPQGVLGSSVEWPQLIK
jgi:hypothetical protein